MDIMGKTSTKRVNRMSYANAFDINGKVPPQALEIEEAVLGALMLDQNARFSVVDALHEEFFYKIEHQVLYATIRKMVEQNKKIDQLTVIEQLRKDGMLETAGGAYYISQMTNNVVSAAHIDYHARILSEKYIQRELIRVSTETIAESYDETTDVVSLLDKTEERLMAINDKNFRSDIKKVDGLVSQAITQIKESKGSDTGLTGIPSGFRDLDRITSGFQSGTLIILAARPAMGKTAFALSMARNMAVDFKKPIAFFSLEMTGVELAMRLISGESEISSEKLKKGTQLAPWEEQQLISKTQTLNDAPIYIDDTPGISIFELRAKCRRMKQRYDIQMVFIDYLQLMTASSGENSRGNGNREQEISTISRQLKGLSKELGIPVLAMSQLSRAVETRGGDKKPILSDLRESGAIEQDADIVMFIYRPEYYNISEDAKGSTIGKADILIAKHRSGGTGDVRLEFKKQFVKFENMAIPIEDQFASNLNMPRNSNFEQVVTVNSSMNYQHPNDSSDFDNKLGDGGDVGFSGAEPNF